MLYAVDKVWWERYWNSASSSFAGDLICGSGNCFGAKRPLHAPGLNSGAGALLHAKWNGAEKVIMVGYDCGYGAEGQTHWHGDHPRGLGNAGSVRKWPAQFAALDMSGVRVINASRKTALECFERMSLEEALQC